MPAPLTIRAQGTMKRVRQAKARALSELDVSVKAGLVDDKAAEAVKDRIGLIEEGAVTWADQEYTSQTAFELAQELGPVMKAGDVEGMQTLTATTRAMGDLYQAVREDTHASKSGELGMFVKGVRGAAKRAAHSISLLEARLWS